ncbi:MAG: HEAT repeat domain-containing protein [Woeseiaceae bacterium]
MSDQIDNDANRIEFDDASNSLFNAIGDLPRQTPDTSLRRRVMLAAHAEHDKLSMADRVRRWWLKPQAVAAMISSCAVGLLLGTLIDTGGGKNVNTRVAELETRMQEMDRELVINRLTAGAATDRMSAVLNAASYAANDSLVTGALLRTAVNDPVASVRAAAIAGLGGSIDQPEVGEELLRLLTQYDSTTVQLAIVDVILRHGDGEQIQALEDQAERNTLSEPLNEYVLQATRGETI